MSNFQVEFGKDRNGQRTLQTIPIYYGDASRQASQILRKNSENTLNAVPAMAVYISGLAYDRERMQNPYYEGKIHVREQTYDPISGNPTGNQDGLYTIERIMPAPYKLTLKMDIWTSNTDQKHQIVEQIAPLFNPGIEIQNTDNYIDWTSLSVVLLTDVNYSSRSIPVGTEEPIDIATMTFELPIWLTLPAKVKKMGVVTQIIQNIFNTTGEIDFETVFDTQNPIATVRFTPMNYGVYVLGNTITLLDSSSVDMSGEVLGAKAYWEDYITQLGKLTNGVSQIRLEFPFSDGSHEIVGTIAQNPNDPTQLLFTPFANTLPANTLNPVNAIIDPYTVPLDNSNVPIIAPPTGTRYLIINPIGNDFSESAVAWAGAEGTNLVARANDIIEWNGTYWHVSFDSRDSGVQYVTNLNTTTQYRWAGESWVKSVEGLYRAGEWSLIL
jgi:hypothetical protein